jgi:hypothetical protein
MLFGKTYASIEAEQTTRWEAASTLTSLQERIRKLEEALWNTRAETPQSGEREAIVAWLRTYAGKRGFVHLHPVYEVANAIARGEHLSTRPLEGDGE